MNLSMADFRLIPKKPENQTFGKFFESKIDSINIFCEDNNEMIIKMIFELEKV